MSNATTACAARRKLELLSATILGDQLDMRREQRRTRLPIRRVVGLTTSRHWPSTS